MNILFHRRTKQVTGINRDPRPFEFALEVDGIPQVTKVIQEVVGQEQKTNEDGLPLYQTNLELDPETGDVLFEETTESQKAVAFEEQEVTLIITNKDGTKKAETKIVQVPTEWEALEPVMVDKVVDVSVSFEENPSLFTYDEVKNAPLKQDTLAVLQQRNQELHLAVAELGMTESQNVTELRLALAELGEELENLTTGGSE